MVRNTAILLVTSLSVFGACCAERLMFASFLSREPLQWR
jgi:hypothetical protein